MTQTMRKELNGYVAHVFMQQVYIHVVHDIDTTEIITVSLLFDYKHCLQIIFLDIDCDEKFNWTNNLINKTIALPTISVACGNSKCSSN